MELKDLEIYNASLLISQKCWEIYSKFDIHQKISMGNQWISAVDSVGANIAEGFGRFHFLDKNKFNYNARGSLLGAIHWTCLLGKRDLVGQADFSVIERKMHALLPRLNAYIKATKQQVK